MVCNVFVGVKTWLTYDAFLGYKVQFSKLSLVQSLLYKFSLGVKVRFALFFKGSKYVWTIVVGVSSLYISGLRMYCMISYLFFPAKNPLGSKALKAVKMRLKTIKENHHTIFLALHLWDDAKGFHLFIFLHC